MRVSCNPHADIFCLLPVVGCRTGLQVEGWKFTQSLGNFQALFDFRKSNSKDGKEETVGVYAQTARIFLHVVFTVDFIINIRQVSIEKHAIPSTRIYPLDSQSVVCFVGLNRFIFDEVVSAHSILYHFD
jgi:hypothetical protein